MPIQFEYRADLNCLHAVGEGRLSRQDFLDYHRNITIPDPAPHPVDPVRLSQT
jgi:hypothetical protein